LADGKRLQILWPNARTPISPAILILQQLQNGLGLANATGARFGE
jgi:hypothetical protein